MDVQKCCECNKVIVGQVFIGNQNKVYCQDCAIAAHLGSSVIKRIDVLEQRVAYLTKNMNRVMEVLDQHFNMGG